MTPNIFKHPETLEQIQLLMVSQVFTNWVTQHSTPFWARHGFDPRGAFAERLTLEGAVDLVETNRVRVQARQTYSFAVAAELGANRSLCARAASFGVGVLTSQCQRSDGLYGCQIRPGIGLSDDTPELYDNAFVLLAFATVYRVFRLKAALNAGRRLSARIDQMLAKSDPEAGYKERLPEPDIREQNPHMHLCEASLAWFEATGDVASLERAVRVASYVERHFFDRRQNRLRETLPPEVPPRFEVGHMYEWTWLLERLARLSYRAPGALFRRMYAGAQAMTDETDFLPVAQEASGQAIDARQRTWVITELIKAHVATYRHTPSQQIAKRILYSVERLFEEHLCADMLGGWIDERGRDGRTLAKTMTAATGYHVYLACSELADLVMPLRKRMRPRSSAT